MSPVTDVSIEATAAYLRITPTDSPHHLLAPATTVAPIVAVLVLGLDELFAFYPKSYWISSRLTIVLEPPSRWVPLARLRG